MIKSKDIYSGCDHHVAIHLTCQLCEIERLTESLEASQVCHRTLDEEHYHARQEIKRLTTEVRDRDCEIERLREFARKGPYDESAATLLGIERSKTERLTAEHGDMNVQNVKDEKEIERLTAEVSRYYEAARKAIAECNRIDVDHSDACMNCSFLEHSQHQCGLCDLRDIVSGKIPVSDRLKDYTTETGDHIVEYPSVANKQCPPHAFIDHPDVDNRQYCKRCGFIRYPAVDEPSANRQCPRCFGSGIDALPTEDTGDTPWAYCPSCGGDADNGHDRCVPPNAYLCSKCDSAVDERAEGSQDIPDSEVERAATSAGVVLPGGKWVGSGQEWPHSYSESGYYKGVCQYCMEPPNAIWHAPDEKGQSDD